MTPRRSYGGAWQETRALVATWLFDLAMRAHFRATYDMCCAISGMGDPQDGRISA